MPASRRKSFNYAVGMFGTSIPINMLKTYAAIFYIDRLGLTTIQFATILSVYAFIDALDNPIYGFLSDRTRTRWGRRRPWLVIGTLLLVVFFALFYSPPAGMAANMLFAYAAIFYILTGTLDSVINANYGALFPELFRTDSERAATNALRQAFQLVAMIISIALTPLVTSAIGYQMTAIIYGVLGGAVILYMALTSREVRVEEHEEKPRLWDSIKDLVTNRKFWIAGFANAFYSAAMSLVLASLPFFVKYTLQIPDAQSTILFASVLLIIPGFLTDAIGLLLLIAPLRTALGAAFAAHAAARAAKRRDDGVIEGEFTIVDAPPEGPVEPLEPLPPPEADKRP